MSTRHAAALPPAARKDGPDPAFARRARAIRKAYGESLALFAARLTAAGYAVTKAEVSRIENARMVKQFAAVDAYAQLDPQRRGRLWVGWGLTVDNYQGRPATPSAAAPPPPGPVGRLEDELTEIPPPSPPDIRRRA